MSQLAKRANFEKAARNKDGRTELIDKAYPEMARGPKTVRNTEKKEIKRKNTYKLKKNKQISKRNIERQQENGQK